MKVKSKQNVEAETSGNTPLRKSGTAPASGYPRAEALPKVRTGFEDAQGFQEVRILENPGDSFEDAHPFARCAPKTAHLRMEQGSVSGWPARSRMRPAPPSHRLVFPPFSPIDYTSPPI